MRMQPMEWEQIMKIENPYEALRQMEKKVDEENLPVEELEIQPERYAKLHGITVDQMAFYPNGDRVLDY